MVLRIPGLEDILSVSRHLVQEPERQRMINSDYCAATCPYIRSHVTVNLMVTASQTLGFRDTVPGIINDVLLSAASLLYRPPLERVSMYTVRLLLRTFFFFSRGFIKMISDSYGQDYKDKPSVKI